MSLGPRAFQTALDRSLKSWALSTTILPYIWLIIVSNRTPEKMGFTYWTGTLGRLRSDPFRITHHTYILFGAFFSLHSRFVDIFRYNNAIWVYSFLGLPSTLRQHQLLPSPFQPFLCIHPSSLVARVRHPALTLYVLFQKGS